MIPYYLRPRFIYEHVRYLLRYVYPGYVLRAKNGWAPMDTWAFDKHLSLVIAGGLEHLAENTHGYPPFVTEDLEGEFSHDHATEIWKAWLLDKAKWFRWYHAEELNLTPDMTEEQRIAALNFYERQEQYFYDTVLPDFTKRFGNLWD